ncbi:MAG: T9SS type A sorting domain-containing protein [Ignavibacteriae bacterium]|nr:T9SS type A sorting domain-containing protein [Ignavibacteriota bacterium]
MGIIQRYVNILFTFLLIIGSLILFSADNKKSAPDRVNPSIRNTLFETKADTLFPVSKNGLIGFPETVEQIMARNKYFKIDSTDRKFALKNEIEVDRDNLPQNPESPNISRYPKSDSVTVHADKSPQIISTSFTAATLSGTNSTLAYPADDMGAVGPTQFIVAVNGRIVSFDKSTGTADGVINTTTNVFFNSVRNGSGTSDPRIRYDRQTQKWYLVIINVSTPNRILIAVSNTSTITASTVWTFFYIPIDTTVPTISNTCLADYPTLGIDNNALYIGTNNFCGSPKQTFNSTDGYVIRKSSVTGAGPLVVTVFRGLMTNATYAGPYTPQGVDNFDASSTEGYFIGVDGAAYGTLQIRRVSNPGSTPTISSNISLTVPTTSAPITVRHKGNTGGATKYLDALDDRLFAAQMRNGRLWTAHNIGVINTGVPSTTNTRDGCRWYEIQNLSTTPTLVQSGTVYTSNTTNTLNDRNYWIPTLNVSGQGHVAMVFTTAGTNEYVNVGTVGRLSTDAAGTMQTPALITTSTTAYNATYNRWGDYSYVSVDPDDDMTMWCVHQFCDATNSYGVRATKLKAPPPATPSTSLPAIVNSGLASTTVVITGISVSGSGWFDPGAGFSNRINATLSNGATLNSITYTDPTHVTLDINTTNVAGPFSPNADVPIFVTIVNPDGQSMISSTAIISVQGALPVELSSFNFSVTERDAKLKWVTASENNNKGFEIQRVKSSELRVQSWEKIGFVQGKGTVNTSTEYSFDDKNLQAGKYNYRLKQIDVNGNFEYFNLNGEVEIGMPKKFDLSQNYPNPFNPNTVISYQLPVDSKVSLVIYDMTGREVKTLVNERRTAGYYTISFDGSGLASGIYLYRIYVKTDGSDFTATKKMMMVK